MIDLAGSELSTRLFLSLRRSDQRRKAQLYLMGLLAAQGRKSMRNISAALDGADDGATEQSLHHFISSSTWDWRPVRRALVEELTSSWPQHAWVVRALPISKAGNLSVGVDRLFVPHLGQSIHGQLAFGLWFVTGRFSVPVSWRLFLPHDWLRDTERRSRAEIPPTVTPEELDECAVEAALTLTDRGGSPRRCPVVLDQVTGRPGPVAAAFGRAGVPFLAGITGRTVLSVADPALPGAGAAALPAEQILQGVRGLRRPVPRSDRGFDRGRISWAAAVPVRVPHGPGDRATGAGPLHRLSLLGEWEDLDQPPARLWLSGVPGMPAGPLLRLARTVLGVRRDEETLGRRMGLRDFEGRSFPGWHRHMTLASVACAMSATAAEHRARAENRAQQLSLSA
ncbi:IS701 family transposase [Streptomyces luteireticuli]|uniref:Transposase n=1 Tax=Streptomyces luteireticuli TaxID=173858 RepID=A0ABN0YKE1_9ACTN